MTSSTLAPGRHRAPDASIRPNREGWAFARKVYGFKKDTELADAMGVSSTTIWRVLVDQTQVPGEDFIAKALVLFWAPENPERHFGFHELFEGPWCER